MFRTAETINCFALDILKEIFGQVLRIVFNIKKKKIKCIFPTVFLFSQISKLPSHEKCY